MARHTRISLHIAATLLAALATLSANAQSSNGKANEPANVLRIGYQKSGLLAILKAQGSLDE